MIIISLTRKFNELDEAILKGDEKRAKEIGIDILYDIDNGYYTEEELRYFEVIIGGPRYMKYLNRYYKE